jgi:hypothetical protein
MESIEEQAEKCLNEIEYYIKYHYKEHPIKVTMKEYYNIVFKDMVVYNEVRLKCIDNKCTVFV